MHRVVLHAPRMREGKLFTRTFIFIFVFADHNLIVRKGSAIR
jgi:hypothetical protein